MEQIVQGLGLRAATILLALGLMNEHHAQAASPGCSEANRGALNADIPPGRSAARSAALVAGESLSLSVATQGSAAIELEGGAGAPKRLYAGSSSGSVWFAATAEDTYEFRYVAGEGAPVTVRASCTSVADADARRAFLERRTGLLTAQDPDRTRIDRPATAPVAAPVQAAAGGTSLEDIGAPKPASISVSVSELAAAAGAKQEPSILDFWFEGHYQPYEAPDPSGATGEGNLGVMYVGTKYMVGPDIMLGALAQFDRAVESPYRKAGDVSASGWMAGPYMSVRFGPGVIFDGRAAWGASESSSVPGIGFGEGSDDRRLVRGKLRGNRTIAGWTFAPSVGLSYVEDGTALAAAASTEAAPPQGQGRLDVLPEIRRRFDVNSATYIEPRATLGGFVTFDELGKISPGAVADAPDLHMKAEAGVAVGVKDGMSLEAAGGVETGGATAPDTYTGRLQLNVPFGK